MGKKETIRGLADYLFWVYRLSGKYDGCLGEGGGRVLGTSGLCPDGMWLFSDLSQSA